MLNKSIDLSKNKIKYLALGDSIAEGFNPLYSVGFPGEMKSLENNKKIISGISYPAYYANMLNSIDPNILETFENFAITGSRIVDWLYFLGVNPEKYNYSNSIKQIKAAQILDLKENNPYKKRIKNQFGLFGLKTKTDFNNLKQKIKKANLITITIGANDLLTKIPFVEIMLWKNNKITKEELDLILNKEINKVTKQAILLFKTIKKMNPKATIIATSYQESLPKLFSLAHEKLDKNTEYENGFILYCLSLLNKLVINASKKANIHFLNIQNNEYWEKNIDRLSTVFFEIHPTTKGYKNMAYELFFKTCLSNDFYTKPLIEIKKIFPNINQNFINNNDINIYNILYFSQKQISDLDLINLSKLNNEDFFWIDNKQEKPFLHLQRKISAKNYLRNTFEKSNKNFTNILQQLLIMINLNDFILSKLLNQISNNKSQFSLLIKMIIESNYLDNIIDKIQEEINLTYFTETNITGEVNIDLLHFEEIILKHFLNIENFIYLIRDIAINLNKINNKNLLEKFKNLIDVILLNLGDLNKYNKKTKQFIKEKILTMIYLKNKVLDAPSVNELINYFILNNKWNDIAPILINSYFEIIKNSNNLKNNYTFVEKYLKEFLREINFNLLTNKFLKLNEIQFIFSKTFINIFDIQDSTENDILIIKKMFNFLIINIKEKDFLINILSKLFLVMIFNGENKASFNSINFVWNLKGFEFWNFLKIPKFKIIKKEQNDIFVFSNIINLIFEKTKFDGSFYTNLKNIKNPKTNKNLPIKNILNISKDIIFKIAKIEKIYSLVFDYLYNAFIESKKIDKQLKNKDNDCYKALYRYIVSSLWIGYRLFQKDIPINIFWNTKKTITHSLPSISNQIYKMCLGKVEDPERKKIIDSIFGNTDIEINNISISEKNYSSKSILWYIKTCEINKNDVHSKKTKEEIIIESLQNGYWK